MLAGTEIAISYRGSKIQEAMSPPPPLVPAWSLEAVNQILVTRLGAGFWRNGGWILKGGRLAQAVDESSMIELYGKVLIHRYSYFAFPFHRDPPERRGYEFFLLQRPQGAALATIVRQWTFRPEEVAEVDLGYPKVRDALKYDRAVRAALVVISGLQRSFEERVDLSAVGSSPPREVARFERRLCRRNLPWGEAG